MLRPALVAFAFLIAGAAQPGAAQQLPAQEARVNLLSQGEPDSLDPGRASFAFAAEAAVVRQVFEPLLRFDEQLTPQPAAAERYDVSVDGRVVTFHLRADARWSDGQPVTAAQFEYAWRRLLDPATKSDYSPLFVAAGVVGVQAIDDDTFEVRLNQPFGPLFDLAALWVAAPVRSDLVDANPEGWAQDPTTYIGNGPFVVSEWVHHDHLTLAPNPYYTAHLSWPKPTLARVTVPMATSGEADLAAYLSGDRDWTVVPDADVNQVLNDPKLASQTRQYTELTTYWVHVNNARGPLANVNVRRALAKALDRSALVRDIAAGIGVPTTSLIPRGMPGFQEGLGKELDLDAPGGRALLAQAGFANGRGLGPIAFSYPSTGTFRRRAEYLRDQWQANLGIDIALKEMDTRAYEQALSNKNYDLAFGGWGADYPDPQDWFQPLFGCNGGFNTFNYCSPTFDQIVARADTALDPGDRLQRYGQAQALLVQDVPVLPLFVRGRLALIPPWVGGIDGGPLPITALDEYPGSFFLDKAQILPH